MFNQLDWTSIWTTQKLFFYPVFTHSQLLMAMVSFFVLKSHLLARSTQDAQAGVRWALASRGRCDSSHCLIPTKPFQHCCAVSAVLTAMPH